MPRIFLGPPGFWVGEKQTSGFISWVRDFPPPPKNTPRKIVVIDPKRGNTGDMNKENLPKRSCGPIPFTPPIIQ